MEKLEKQANMQITSADLSMFVILFNLMRIERFRGVKDYTVVREFFKPSYF